QIPRQGFELKFERSHPDFTTRKSRSLPGFDLSSLKFRFRSGFLSQDPIGFLAGQNRFSYCRNNPLKWADPYGLCTPDVYQPQPQVDTRTYIGPAGPIPLPGRDLRQDYDRGYWWNYQDPSAQVQLSGFPLNSTPAYSQDFVQSPVGQLALNAGFLMTAEFGGEALNALRFELRYFGSQTGLPIGYRGGPGAMWQGQLLPGRAGSFSELDSLRLTGDALTPHHMPQAALGFTSYGEGGAFMLPQDIHVLTRTYGIGGRTLAAEESGLSFRTILGRDIRDVRRLTGSEYNAGLRDLLNYYRQNFPELMTKP
ncbi:MAG: hypothetical protein HQM08_29170, partial [Candidatus Riflebacteria bacterium]|nr:hypothetical protein [Candidatus Riflebacteria bacterium]